MSIIFHVMIRVLLQTILRNAGYHDDRRRIERKESYRMDSRSWIQLLQLSRVVALHNRTVAINFMRVQMSLSSMIWFDSFYQPDREVIFECRLSKSYCVLVIIRPLRWETSRLNKIHYRIVFTIVLRKTALMKEHCMSQKKPFCSLRISPPKMNSHNYRWFPWLV